VKVSIFFDTGQSISVDVVEMTVSASGSQLVRLAWSGPANGNVLEYVNLDHVVAITSSSEEEGAE